MPSSVSVEDVCRAVKEAGGRAYLVGGLVRDRALGIEGEARDYDLEVYGLGSGALLAILERFGSVNAVGQSFAVYKLGEMDVSIPRRVRETDPGRQAHAVDGDPSMSVEEASRRRDFTINAMLSDPLTGEVIDPHGGLVDLKARRLRAVDPVTFVEDPLRVLRGMQFAARFELSIDPATVALCRSVPLGDLPSERIWGEIDKLLLRPRRPSIGLEAGLAMGVMHALFPDLAALVGCPQDPTWHPEGDVWVHTLQAVDVAAGLVGDLALPRRTAVMLGILCHDLGKPPTTKVVDGRIRSLDHEGAGVTPTTRLLDRLNVQTLDGYDVRRQVIALVADHLKPGLFYADRDRVSDGAFRRLALRVELDLLYRVAKADSLGRRAPGAKEPSSAAQEWFRDKAQTLQISHEAPKPLLLGRHLLELGLTPGPRIGKVINQVYELQLEGSVRTLEEAIDAARAAIRNGHS